MKLPAFISHAIERNGDFCKITLTKRQLQILIGVVSTLLVLSLALGIWGALRQAELIQLRQQTQLQTEQLKLLQQKTQMLDKKIQTLDALDQEIRQMVKGAESGQPSQGGGESEKPQAALSDISDVNLTPSQMSAKLSKIDKQAQKRLASFYTLRNILKDGASADIAAVQSINFATRSGMMANSTTPSIWPSKGVITSNYGYRTDPVYGSSAFHEGIDIADDYATQIVATAAGTVTFAGPTSGGYGNLVEIDHGNGFVTKYGHNSVVLVTEGMHVNQGQAVALMGSTGKSTGSHVHYEVDINGTAVDPMVFLPISND